MWRSVREIVIWFIAELVTVLFFLNYGSNLRLNSRRIEAMFVRASDLSRYKSVNLKTKICALFKSLCSVKYL